MHFEYCTFYVEESRHRRVACQGEDHQKYLGKDFEVLASYGHVRDLIPKEGAVDTENGFAMKYQVIERNEKHVKAIMRALKKADALYLATDPDREGEAISWHLVELLKEKGALDDKAVHRVVFHEITKAAVREAIANPRGISGDLVGAQQARRALDYLVGFNLSPLLWKKVQRGLSAGRVQSPALRMIVERELEIEAFKAREYWSIEADVSKNEQPFLSRLVAYAGDKVEQFSFENETAARAVEKTILEAAAGELTAVSGQQEAAPAQPDRTVHDLDAAAGGVAQAGLQHAMDHARRAKALRRHRPAGRRHRRPDYLYAYRLGDAGRRCRHRNSRSYCRALRQGERARGSTHVQEQVQECAGSA